MKNSQKGFVGILVVIVLAVAIGGFVYYQYKNTQKQSIEISNDSTIEVQTDTTKKEEVKNIPPKKPVVMNFEAKARASAQKSECGNYGSIGTAIKLQEEYDYALFTISNSSKADLCAVDLYAGTVIALNTKPICDSKGENCHGTGALPTPKKLYESIPQAPDLSTFR